MRYIVLLLVLFSCSKVNVSNTARDVVKYKYENYSITQDVLHISVPIDSDTTYIKGAFEGVLGIPVIIGTDVEQSDVNLNRDDLRKLRDLVNGGELNEVYNIINRKVQL